MAKLGTRPVCVLGVANESTEGNLCMVLYWVDTSSELVKIDDNGGRLVLLLLPYGNGVGGKLGLLGVCKYIEIEDMSI